MERAHRRPDVEVDDDDTDFDDPFEFSLVKNCGASWNDEMDEDSDMTTFNAEMNEESSFMNGASSDVSSDDLQDINISAAAWIEKEEEEENRLLGSSSESSLHRFAQARVETLARNLNFVHDETGSIVQARVNTFSHNVDYAQAQAESLTRHIGKRASVNVCSVQAHAESLTRHIAEKRSSLPGFKFSNQELEDVALRGFSFSRDVRRKDQDRLAAAWQEEIRRNSMLPQIKEEEDTTMDTSPPPNAQNPLSAFVFARVCTLSRNINHAQRTAETWSRVSTFSRNMDYMRAQASSVIWVLS